MNIAALFGLFMINAFVVACLSDVCPVTFEKKSCNYGNSRINKCNLLMEEKLGIEDIGGLNETAYLNKFTCECAKLARGKEQLAMVVTVTYLIEIDGTENQLYSKCNKPLGMENEIIPDNRVTASPVWNYRHGAGNARLHFKSGSDRTGAWSAKHNDKNQWLQVDLGSFAVVTQIATQGRWDLQQWVKSYTISFSLDGDDFHFYKNRKELNRVFTANSDRDTVVTNTLPTPVEARFIRIHPVTWHDHISLRAEIYGCKSVEKCNPKDPLPSKDFEKNKRFPGSPLQIKTVYSELQCADFCFRNHRCVAFNIQLTEEGKGKQECQLMGTANDSKDNVEWGCRRFDREQFRKVMFGENPCQHDEL